MKTQRLTLIAALLVVVASVPSFGQEKSGSSVAAEKMSKVAWMDGNWKGTGWYVTSTGERESFTIDEKAHLKLGGVALYIEGLGRDKNDRIAHNALAILSYDDVAGKYRIHAITKEGRATEATPIVGDGSIVWGFAIPNRGEVRFTMKQTERGEWHEVGEFSRDGQTWIKFLEMTLTKVSS